jgi:hypothetical protein
MARKEAISPVAVREGSSNSSERRSRSMAALVQVKVVSWL